jgi:hypothetical protein
MSSFSDKYWFLSFYIKKGLGLISVSHFSWEIIMFMMQINYMVFAWCQFFKVVSGKVWQWSTVTKSYVFTMHKSYCPTIRGFDMFLQDFQRCSNFQFLHLYCVWHWEVIFLHFCSRNFRTFLSVTLKLPCWGPWKAIWDESDAFSNSDVFVFSSTILSVPSQGISVLCHSCWFLQHV